MKVLIVGAGGQGGACASILARQEAVEEIRLVDLKEETAKAVADKIGSPKVKTGSVNATDPDDVARAAEGVDVVVDMVMPWMVTYVMKGALKAGANYINTAFDAPYWDEFLEGKSVDEHHTLQGIQRSRTHCTLRMWICSGNDKCSGKKVCQQT